MPVFFKFRFLVADGCGHLVGKLLFRLTAGVYYLNQLQKQNIIAPLFQFAGAGSVALRANVRQRSKGYAVFANAEYDLNDKLTAIAGIRWSRDEKSIQQTNGMYGNLDPLEPFKGYERDYKIPVGATLGENEFTDATAGGLNKFGKNLWSAKFELDYKPSEGTLIYASVNRGVKAPGYNNGLVSIGLPFSEYYFKPERLMAYEVGLKSNIFGRMGNISVSSFYYDYKDYHAISFIGVGSFITNNDAKLYGLEADISLKPVRGLTIQVNGGLLHSKLYDAANAAQIVDDREMPIAPSWTISGLVRYDFDVDGKRVGFQLDGRARDAFFNNPGNDTAAKVPSYGILNGNLDISDSDGKYKFSIGVKNIFDKRYKTSIFLLNGVAGYRYGFYAPPRWVTAEFSVNF
ncbi:TonB-dependent receptor [Tsuneonella sp. CC-YZS046]|uniref:TonB-dependent receptor n=1 Tax=Tsuneonella sp. CC-YZS046 TaxID=3042152 RepID=UPI002D791E34|nr:TonB-dependent receptor [Tsuneonella sp. CC-YZS046]WRO67919.1 TonB-dependent receptor [Tsuneonella sp. CC-YZS046]